MESTITNAVIYARTARQDDASSLPAQVEMVRAYGEAKGCTIVHVIEETASGADLNRAGLQKLFALLEPTGARPVEVVLVADGSRLSRSVAHLRRLQESLAGRGVRIECVQEAAGEQEALGRLIRAAGACRQLRQIQSPSI